MRRTRELNAAVQARPGEEQRWLDLADFQSEALPLLNRGKGGAAARAAAAAEPSLAAEKKIAILQRALTHHPASERIVAELLRAAEAIASPEQLQQRWRAALARHPGSSLLQQAHIEAAKRRFEAFLAPDVQEMYTRAIESLGAERGRKLRGFRVSGDPSMGAEIERLEVQLVDLALGACCFSMSTGHTEQAVGAIQAVLEFHCCRPPLPPMAAPVLQLFKDFWRSDCPRIGEAGARGWNGWFREHVLGLPTLMDDNQRLPTAVSAASSKGIAAEPEAAERQDGGWSGWVQWTPEDEGPTEASAPMDTADDADEASDVEDAEDSAGTFDNLFA